MTIIIHDIPVTVFRKASNYISLRIKEGAVSITVPEIYKNESIEFFILKKMKWIVRKQKEHALFRKNYERKFISGEEFYVLGEQKMLVVQESQIDSINIERNRIIVNSKKSSKNYVKVLLENWYKKYAVDYLHKKTYELHKKFASNKEIKILIKDCKGKWGSCSNTGNIILSYRLTFVPVECIEYIIIHELCHLYHMDHSTKFWKKVELYMPYYKKYKKLLQEYNFNYFSK